MLTVHILNNQALCRVVFAKPLLSAVVLAFLPALLSGVVLAFLPPLVRIPYLSLCTLQDAVPLASTFESSPVDVPSPIPVVSGVASARVSSFRR